ncbi:complement factor I isoform X2 [Leucoraja erinacea]|uniref:complement factor I isoform X2 n=1 Tax=Leucoraja erinaceus TaxID=7782 RepID=UPI002455D3B6|nr:complement factor I isoform X2 [Leucoraja erinacea]
MILSVPLLSLMCLFVTAIEQKKESNVTSTSAQAVPLPKESNVTSTSAQAVPLPKESNVTSTSAQAKESNETSTSAQATSNTSVARLQRLSEDCLHENYTYKSCQKVFCQPWEKCLHGKCVCKVPYQCPKIESPVCSTNNRRFRSYCQLKSFECQRNRDKFSHFGECSSGQTNVHFESDNSTQGVVFFSFNQTAEKLPICQKKKKSWTMHEANVVCRQLNFELGAESLLKNVHIPGIFKMVNWANNSRCRGFETSLSECFQFKNIGAPMAGCKKGYFAAVKCYHYPPDKVCTGTEFKCVNGKCIPLENVCNGIDDCADLSDELCCTECKESYHCKTDICIPNISICDGEDDCLDGSDEKNCNETKSTKDDTTERSLLKSSFPEISCGISNYTSNTPSRTSGRSKRLLGGLEAAKKQFPWQIAVYSNNILNCGGIFIGGCWILTAAHCLRPYHLSNYVVRIAKYNKRDISKREEILPVEKIITHYDYNPRTYENDIALLKVVHVYKDEECIPLSEDVQPVCVPWSNYLFTTNKTCTVSGWGIAEDGVRVNVLRYADIEIIGNCAAIYQSAFFEGMLCAGKLEGKIDSCKGDSGGPLVCSDERNNAYVWGIVSWGKECGAQGFPGVYTKVSHYFEWISKNVGRHIISKYNI